MILVHMGEKEIFCRLYLFGRKTRKGSFGSAHYAAIDDVVYIRLHEKAIPAVLVDAAAHYKIHLFLRSVSTFTTSRAPTVIIRQMTAMHIASCE